MTLLGKQAPGLVVRDCYPAFLDLVVGDDPDPRFAILGTPGIGKSFFSVYLLWWLAHSGASVVFKPAGAPSDQTYHRYLLRPGGKCTTGAPGDFTDVLADPAAWYILDAHEPERLGLRARTVLLTSPREEVYEEWTKQVDALVRFMPVWTEDEMHRCHATFGARLGLTVGSLNWRYALVGGNARLLFSPRPDDEMLEKINRAINKTNLDACLAAVSGQPSGDKTTGRLVHIVPTNGYRGCRYTFASPAVARLLSRTFAAKERAKVLAFLHAADGMGEYATLRGFLFEALAHEALARGDTLPLRAADAAWDGVTVLSLGRRTIVQYSALREVDLSAPSSYYRPVAGNQAAVDSIAGPGYFFQCTVSGHHPIKAARFREVLNGVGFGGGVPDIYFVVPQSLFDSFSVQPFVGVDGHQLTTFPAVRQWVLAFSDA